MKTIEYKPSSNEIAEAMIETLKRRGCVYVISYINDQIIIRQEVE